MTRIYQALERANLENLQPDRKVASSLPTSRTTPMDPKVSSRVEGLYHTLTAMLPSARGSVIQFLGAHSGAGVTTMVSEFARVVESTHRRSVLILSADNASGSYCGEFGLTSSVGLHEVLSDGRPAEDAITQVGTSHLYFATFTSSGIDSGLVDSELLEEAFEQFRDRYDFVLIDAPPALESPVGLALGSLSDGVIMVVEAEKTRWQVADSVHAALEQHGANVLGVVMNKRRYHIPEFIYRLF